MIRVTDKQYWMDAQLANNLNTVIYNLPHDWDFVCVMTGNGMVRVGKSVLAQQVGYYVAHHLGTSFNIDNIVFSGDELIGTAHKLKPNSVIIYDEARAELDVAKTMERVSKILRDFFAECGMYNHFIILVLPDYFELNKRIAVTRSDFLINVFRHSEKKVVNDIEVMAYKRGYYEFYNRVGKKKLYINGKKEHENYDLGIRLRSFWGNFHDYWVVDKDAYMKKKLNFLARDRISGNYGHDREGILLKSLCEFVSQREAVKVLAKNGLELTQGRICQLINSISKHEPRETALD